MKAIAPASLLAGPIFSPIFIRSQQLHVLSLEHRLYVGLSRDASYLHVVSPQIELTDTDGNVVRPAGTLGCTCRGAVFHGSCYRTRQAEALERGEADVDVWVNDAAPGELVEAFGK